MQLCEAEKRELRARLASRQSFFGGSLSTARDSVARDYLPPELRFREVPKAEPQRLHPRSKASLPASKATARPASVAQPSVKKSVDYSDFDSLGSETPPSAALLSQSDSAASTAHPLSQQTGTSNTQTLARPKHAAQHPQSASLPPTKRPIPQLPHRGATPPASLAQHSQIPYRSRTPPVGLSRHFHVTPRSATPPAGLARHSPPRKPPASSVSPQRSLKGNGSTPHRTKKGQPTRRFSVEPQALGGPTRSQKANQAWAKAAAKLRNPNAVPRAITPPNGTGASSTLAASGRSPIDPARRHRLTDTVTALQGVAKASHHPSTAKSNTATPKRVEPKRMNLAGKDLSGLPDWQRQMLEKKFREEARLKRRREQEVLDEYESEDDFIADEDTSDWRQELKTITGYDPSKYKDERFDDRSMEADWKSIQAEERRSAKMGRSEDEKAELEELARQKAKAASKKKRAKTSFALV